MVSVFPAYLYKTAYRLQYNIQVALHYHFITIISVILRTFVISKYSCGLEFNLPKLSVTYDAMQCRYDPFAWVKGQYRTGKFICVKLTVKERAHSLRCEILILSPHELKLFD